MSSYGHPRLPHFLLNYLINLLILFKEEVLSPINVYCYVLNLVQDVPYFLLDPLEVPGRLFIFLDNNFRISFKL